MSEPDINVILTDIADPHVPMGADETFAHAALHTTAAPSCYPGVETAVTS